MKCRTKCVRKALNKIWDREFTAKILGEGIWGRREKMAWGLRGRRRVDARSEFFFQLRFFAVCSSLSFNFYDQCIKIGKLSSSVLSLPSRAYLLLLLRFAVKTGWDDDSNFVGSYKRCHHQEWPCKALFARIFIFQWKNQKENVSLFPFCFFGQTWRYFSFPLD